MFAPVQLESPATRMDMLKVRWMYLQLCQLIPRLEQCISSAITSTDLPDYEFDRIIDFAEELLKEIRIQEGNLGALVDLWIIEYVQKDRPRSAPEYEDFTKVHFPSD